LQTRGGTTREVGAVYSHDVTQDNVSIYTLAHIMFADLVVTESSTIRYYRPNDEAKRTHYEAVSYITDWSINTLYTTDAEGQPMSLLMHHTIDINGLPICQMSTGPIMINNNDANFDIIDSDALARMPVLDENGVMNPTESRALAQKVDRTMDCYQLYRILKGVGITKKNRLNLGNMLLANEKIKFKKNLDNSARNKRVIKV